MSSILTFLFHPPVLTIFFFLGAQKQLYSSMGKIFILQQDERSSPAHPSFPPGSALYELENAHGATTAGAHIRWKPLVTLQHMVLKVRFLGTRI